MGAFEQPFVLDHDAAEKAKKLARNAIRKARPKDPMRFRRISRAEMRRIERTNNLPPRVLKAWIYALRSGVYSQVQGSEREGQYGERASYCAIGLLRYIVLGDCTEGNEVMDGLELAAVIDHNDDDGWSFPKIGDWLEETKGKELASPAEA